MNTRKVPVVERVMSANDALALENRRVFDAHGVRVVNIMAAPGAGKTSLILQTAKQLADRLRIGVIEGDLASTIDADKVREEGFLAVQINTGGGCHLDANQVGAALREMPLDEIDLLFIENVGNLVCPAGFALGEHARVVISSIPEGDDKPIKYPKIFTNLDAVVINKIDLLPYLSFDMEAFQGAVRGLGPDVEIFPVSCVTGEGLDAWVTWLLNLCQKR